MRKKRINEGITLIALVVTIVVLLILAGVSLNLVLGNNGIITKAKDAKNAYEQGKINDETAISEADYDIESIIEDLQEKAEKIEDENPGEMEGTGTASDPFVINSIEDLVAFSKSVNGGKSYNGNTIKLGYTLDFKSDNSYVEPTTTEFGDVNKDGTVEGLKIELLKGEGFSPIGNYNTDAIPFAGVFDGNKKSIKNLYINYKGESGEYDAGLFGYVIGTIQDLYVLNCNIELSTYFGPVGAIVGVHNGKLYRCAASGKIVNKSKIGCTGGIAGTTSADVSDGIIDNCYNFTNLDVISEVANSEVVSTDEVQVTSRVGGIIGEVYGKEQKILNCYNRGNIMTKTKNVLISAGGIVGMIGLFNFDILSFIDKDEFGGTIENCYNQGNVNYEFIEGDTVNQAYLGTGIGLLGEKVTVNNLYGINNQPIIGESQSYFGYSSACTNIGQKTAEELKSENMLSLLGTEFKKDVGINEGYPILNWQ